MLPPDVDSLIDFANQVHLDPSMGSIEKRTVSELVDGKVCVQGAVDMREQVAVEGGGYPPLVVIGLLKPLGVFDEVDPNQQLATAGSAELSKSLKQGLAILLAEVADGRAGEKEQPSSGVGGLFRNSNALVEIGTHRPDRQGCVVMRQFVRGLDEVLPRDVEGDITRWRLEGIQKEPDLAAISAPRLDDKRAGTDRLTDLCRMLLQNRNLGAGGVVLLKLANLIEENAEELAMLEVLDNGKPYAEAINLDLPLSIQCYRYYAGWADKISGQVINPSFS